MPSVALWYFGLKSKAIVLSWGTSSKSSSKRFAISSVVTNGEAGNIATRLDKAGDQAGLDRIATSNKNDRDGGVSTSPLRHCPSSTPPAGGMPEYY